MAATVIKKIARVFSPFSLAVISTVAVMIPGLAFADTQIVEFTANTGTNLRFADGSNGNPKIVCQLFSGLSGEVDYVKVHMSQRGSGGSGTITISLQSVSGSNPTGTILSSGTIPFTSLTGSVAQYTITFGSPTTLNSGTTYALCGSNSATTDATDGVYFNGDSSQYSSYKVRYQEGVTNTWVDYGTDSVSAQLWTAAGGGGGGGGSTSTVATSTDSTSTITFVASCIAFEQVFLFFIGLIGTVWIIQALWPSSLFP